MAYIERSLRQLLERAARQFPAVVLTGPRRAGKTTLLRRVFPGATYVLLEDPLELARLRTDPHGFVEGLEPPVILDEIQNAPELFAYVRTLVDAHPARRGRFFLTGSQDAPLMRGVGESLAGRAAVLQLLPLSLEESPKVSLLRGGFPELVARRSDAGLWFRSYVQTYLERDVRAVTDVRDLSTFRRFLALVASRTGQMLNRVDLAAPLGVSSPTIGQWLSILEVTGTVLVIPPYFESFGKRLVKSPKIYFVDSGLGCHLLGLDDARALEASPFIGPIFEGFVAAEIVKHQVNRGRRPELYYFRDQAGLEVDFVVPRGGHSLTLVEAKSGRSVAPSDARSLTRLAAITRERDVDRVVVHRPSKRRMSTALSAGARAYSVAELLASLP